MHWIDYLVGVDPVHKLTQTSLKALHVPKTVCFDQAYSVEALSSVGFPVMA